MPLKIQPASPDEHAFAAKVNEGLRDIGASISAYSLVDIGPEGPTSAIRLHGLVFSCGGRRHSMQADSPFHYDPPEDVIQRVRDWVASRSHADRWSTDVKYAE